LDERDFEVFIYSMQFSVDIIHIFFIRTKDSGFRFQTQIPV
jgi:hypothetical protein